ncbi:MAG TPA: SGNH/GDSL hydrolase family protein [Acetobacteraceae bacterium]|nr:SGNH/GDSL hydrolase family protein [Acetobacteraceae bacterium]
MRALTALLILVGLGSSPAWASPDPTARALAIQASAAATAAVGPAYTGAASVREIGNRVAIANQKSGSQTRAGFRTWEVDYVGGNPKVCFSNFIVNSTVSGVETATGGAMNLKLYVELNGVVTPFTWGGAATSSIASGGYGCTDPSPVVIPPYTKYRLCGDMQMGSGGTIPSEGWSNSADLPGGDEYQVGTTSDFCASNTKLATSAAAAIMPALIIAPSSLSVWGVVGDSITAGVNYTQQQPSGGRGILAALAEYGPALNYGVPGDKATWYATNSTVRRQLLALGGVTALVDELGVNDLTGSRTAAQLLADRATIRGLFPGVTIYETTIMPTTSTTDGYKTAANQAVAGSSAQRTSFNDTERGGVAGVASLLDFAAEVETSTTTEQGFVLDGGVWTASCMVGSDGTHPVEQCERSRLAPLVRALRSNRR